MGSTQYLMYMKIYCMQFSWALVYSCICTSASTHILSLLKFLTLLQPYKDWYFLLSSCLLLEMKTYTNKLKCVFPGVTMSKAKSRRDRRINAPGVTRVTRSSIITTQDSQRTKPTDSGLVDDLSLMSVSEQQALLARWDATSLCYALQRTISNYKSFFS